jgi:hypothetical protein
MQWLKYKIGGHENVYVFVAAENNRPAETPYKLRSASLLNAQEINPQNVYSSSFFFHKQGPRSAVFFNLGALELHSGAFQLTLTCECV